MSLTRLRLLPLLLAGLLALAPALAAADGRSPAAQAARRARRRGHAHRRGARRRGASGAVPRPFDPLWSADRSLRVLIVLQRERTSPRPRQVVQLQAGSVPATCPTSGETRVLVVVQAYLRGSSFAVTQADQYGGRKRLSGRFTSATRATGEFQATFPDQRGGGMCDTGTVTFTARRP